MPEERIRDLPEVLAEEARAADVLRGGHPSDDDLLDHRDGVLPREAEERLLDHLAACPECAERFLDLDALSPDHGMSEDAGEPAPVDLSERREIDAMWRRLEPEIGEGAGVAPGGPAGSGVGGHRALRALAAGLTVAVLGLGVWVAQLRREVDRLGAPRVNPAVLYLDEPVRARAAPPPELAAPADGDAVLLIVTPPGEGDASGYEAVLTADGGEEVWRGGGFRLSDSGTLRVRLPSRYLRPGRYELRLSAPGDAAPPARYRFTVLPEAHGPP